MNNSFMFNWETRKKERYWHKGEQSKEQEYESAT